MRPLLLAVFGSVGALLNMTVFLLLMNVLGALIALQLFQGDIPHDGKAVIDFANIYNSFLGMYQIFSSENWTDPLYSVVRPRHPLPCLAAHICPSFLTFLDSLFDSSSSRLGSRSIRE